MPITRLINSLQGVINRCKKYSDFLQRFLPTSLICLLTGFYIGGNLAPVVTLWFPSLSIINQSVFCIFFIFGLEFINYYLIQSVVTSLFFKILFLHCRNLKQGILLGIFVDAFKVGS